MRRGASFLAALGAAVWLVAIAAAQSPPSASPRTMVTTTSANAALAKKPAPKPAPAPAKPAPTANPAATTSQPSAPPATAPQGEVIGLSAETANGYGRLLFHWRAPVTYDASIADGVLVVTFARPFQLAANQARLPLDDYVSVIRPDRDGKTLRLSLTRQLRLHTSVGGSVVALDMVPPSFAGEPPDLPDPNVKPPAPPGPATVKLNIGVSQDKTRLAFDWGEVVAYEAKVVDGKIEASFAREGMIDVKRLNQNPPAWVKSAKVSAGDDKTLLQIVIDPGSAVEQSRVKTKIVFDIKAPTSDADAQVALPEGLQPALDGPKDEKPAPKPADASANAASSDNKKSEPKTADAKPPGKDASDDKKTGDEKSDAKKPDPKAADDHPVAAEPPDHATTPAPDHTEPSSAEKPEVAAAPVGPPPAFSVTRKGSELTLTLPALITQPAAMFQHGEAAFIVIDGAGAMDVNTILAANKDVIAAATLSKDGTVSILALTLAKPVALTAVQSKGAWAAVLAPDPVSLPRPIVLLRDDRDVGPPRIRATLDRARRAVNLKDPITGEAVVAVLADGEAQGLLAARGYVDFAADKTAQGLGLRPRTDDLAVTIEEHDVIISSADGLILSAATVSDYEPDREPMSDTAAPAAMDFAAWSGKGSFIDERSHLLNAIDPTGKDSEAGRLDLVRFYLAHDLGAEAFGELQFVVRSDDRVARDPAFHALRGVALLELGHNKEAMDDLAVAGLDDDPNAQLFRGVAAARLRQWDGARDNIIEGEAAIEAYRPDWQARFRIAGARGAVETNTVDVAQRMLAAMPKDGVPEPLRLEAELVKAMLDQRLKRDAPALAAYVDVQKSGYRPLAARATLAVISLKEAQGKMKRAEAIEALDHLRWQWRGDDVELGTLHKLGSLQVAGGDYRNGLQTLRAASLGFPDAPESRQIGAEMQMLFEELFLNGKADTLPPVQALGLYYDFKELTPIGAMGDDMVRKLADRLIAVDLLDQAEELLQHQVDKRLDGVAKAQIASKLAAIYLMDRKPQKALEVLRVSAQTRLPDDLASQRRLLTGRALSDLKQYDAAIEAFEQDDTPEARRLRADVLWDGSRWPDAAKAIEVLIAGRDKEARPLDTVERTDVLRAAVAYTLADDDKGLASLRDRFVALMAGTPDASAFDVVTRAVDPSAVEFRQLAKEIAGIDTLDAFLRSLGLGKPAAGSAAK